MATVDFAPTTSGARPSVAGNGQPPRRLHRINTVRKQQQVSLRTAARQIGTDIPTVRSQEKETADLRLSELYSWQHVLDVPIADLLTDPGTPLSRPVMERARLVRLMKTAAAIQERAESEQVRRMAANMIQQLVEIMPELADVNAWHAIGQRRSMDEYGRIMEHPIPDSIFGNHGNTDF